MLSRQNLPQYEGSGKAALKGGYILEDCEGKPDVLLIGTGSEVELCVKAKEALEAKDVKARVISMPCVEEFEKQSDDYKESGYKYAGDKGEIVAMSTFGASAPAKQLFEKFGFTVDNVVEKAIASIENNR